MEQINEFALVLEVQKKALEEANLLLSQRADTDGLTNVMNHRRMQSDLEVNFRDASTQSQQLSVILMDVDRFKAYNDTYGHQAGDDVLRKFAQTLKNVSREGEAVARYGGEEFAIIMPGCGEEHAIAAAERFRVAIEGETWENREITASFGVSTLDDTILSPRELISCADAALYFSKESGRNRVTHFNKLPSDYERANPNKRAA